VARTKQAAEPPVYNVHPSVGVMRAWISGLLPKTGRTLEEWVELVQDEGPVTERERRAWLRAKHGLGTNASWWIAQRAEGRGAEDGDPEAYLKAAAGYVEAMFEGTRTGLRPVYEKILVLARGLGADVKVCPCKTVVPLYRRRIFAEIRPASSSRLDLGLALSSLEGSGRLVETGGFERQDRITHRIALGSLSEVDAEVKRRLKQAYDLDR
jgi:hypothetical protein